MIKNSFRASGFPHAQVQCLVKVTFKTPSLLACPFPKSLKTQCFLALIFVVFRKCWKTLWFWSHFNQKSMKTCCFCQFFCVFSENIWKHNDFDPIGFKNHENTIVFKFFFESVSKWAPEGSIWGIAALAPQVDKMSSRRLALMHSGIGSRSRQNEFQKARFDAFRPWLQKSTKWAPEGSIWAFSGLGSRSRQNELQKGRFEHFQALAPEVDKMGPEGSIWGIPALAPEVDKMSSRRLDLNHSGLGSRSRQNELQKARFEHFQASVDRMPANNDTFNTWGDRMPAKTRCFWFVSIGCPQITTLLTHEAIGCQQKHYAFDICVDRMPANNDTFNTWGDRMPAKTRCFWYLCR